MAVAGKRNIVLPEVPVDLKLVLLGQPGVGKTCLVYRYLYNTFGETISVRPGV